MITQLTPVPGSTLSEILLCDSLYIDGLPNPRLVPLFGPNGIGKTSVVEALISTMTGESKQLDIVCDRPTPTRLLHYRDRKDNARIREPRSYAEAFDPRFFNAKYDAQSLSEGQSILYSVMDLLDAIGTTKHSIPVDGTENIVVLDEIDSGMSIDNLDAVMRKLVRATKRRNDVQVVFSFNNPYVLRYCPTVLSLYTGYPVLLRHEDEMLEYIHSNAEQFRKLRYYTNGRPKIANNKTGGIHNDKSFSKRTRTVASGRGAWCKGR